MTEITIKRLGMQGDGVADGPVYVPLTLPGEIVEGTIEGTVMRDAKILRPSERRVAAPCRHFKSCGGCQMQHADDAFVADWKVDVVRTALHAHGLEAGFRRIVTSPAQSRRRAGFAARRTKKGAMVGFHGRASESIIAIPDCKLLDPAVLTGVPVAEALAVIGASRKTALSVMVTTTVSGLDVAVSHGKPLDGPLRQHLALACDQLGLVRLSWDGEIIAMRAPPVHSFDGISVASPPGAFLQATAHGETALRDAVLEITKGARQVIDLFAGCGTFSLPLARHAEVHAVEGIRDMTDALDQGWRKAQGLKAVTCETRDLFRRPLLPDEMAKAGAIVLDPPRAGAEAQVGEIAKTRVARIAYVSCNPVSFARDAQTLVNAGFTIDWIQVVDQFRWSTHVELVASFTAAHMRDEPRRST
ncbi:23S rRNA (uracil(1939)-C(5))-methyltransferase RlmD [Roseobacter fucihabitans]|uniref:23S rRNA (Uracil(1939)-C(5))-methyltransferase RlmD n=1 Tax=Roseobacter fucihabitans TaxID=1537242 RepID=A0ABZ2C376_9RHOB|nr:class I SAM-dependent RNA methyltransferase [Roseobacter litoralis]MBC6963844.1 23S rRNA (uracil(1939)-C(5))-methyltransferase RlmD [Roseobacter litoralis]MBC6964071.1 23S rRNA (uracil(1939)-C(5))-methyltransferase RlmD [Roseobacter litoralis]